MIMIGMILTTLVLVLLLQASRAIVLTDEGACRIMGFFPTHAASSDEQQEYRYTRWTTAELQRVSNSFIRTAQLAVDHFHQRNTTIVPELADLPDTCQVKLEIDTITTDIDRKQAGNIMLHQARNLCALLGTYDPDVARAMQPLTVSLDLPHVIYYTTDGFLTNSARPTAVGLPPTVLPRARALAEYLNAARTANVLPRQYLAMIYEEAHYTSSYLARCFQEDAADKYGLVSTSFPDDHFGIVQTQSAESLQRQVMAKVAATGVKTIFINKIQSSSLQLTAELLQEYNLLTHEYLYIFTPEAVPTDAVGRVFDQVPVNSPLDKLLRGGLVLDHVDPFRVRPENDPFLNAWKDYPGTNNNNNNNTQRPADYASFLYDSIMAIGMGACHATTTTTTTTTTTPDDDDDDKADITTFRQHIHATNFTGASGRVEWGCYGSNRCNEPLRFGVFNIRPVVVGKNHQQQQHSYEAVLTAVWDQDQRWQRVDDFYYPDGTTTAPTRLREAQENNYLSSRVRGFGLSLFGSSAALSLAGLVALLVLRKNPLVTRSQPFFLALVCVGSFLMNMAILTLSFDENMMGGISERGLDIACTCTVWFFFVGQVLVFAALFSKLWEGGSSHASASASKCVEEPSNDPTSHYSCRHDRDFKCLDNSGSLDLGERVVGNSSCRDVRRVPIGALVGVLWSAHGHSSLVGRPHSLFCVENVGPTRRIQRHTDLAACNVLATPSLDRGCSYSGSARKIVGRGRVSQSGTVDLGVFCFECRFCCWYKGLQSHVDPTTTATQQL